MLLSKKVASVGAVYDLGMTVVFVIDMEARPCGHVEAAPSLQPDTVRAAGQGHPPANSLAIGGINKDEITTCTPSASPA